MCHANNLKEFNKVEGQAEEPWGGRNVQLFIAFLWLALLCCLLPLLVLGGLEWVVISRDLSQWLPLIKSLLNRAVRSRWFARVNPMIACQWRGSISFPQSETHSFLFVLPLFSIQHSFDNIKKKKKKMIKNP